MSVLRTRGLWPLNVGKPLPDWVQIKPVRNKNFQRALLLEVDLGEASAIAMAAENQPSLLIIDDLKGRKLAKKLSISITGTLGLILNAKRQGVIPLIRPVFEKIQLTNFRISPILMENILKEAGEPRA
jgi:predicted nucleic acid-binding protein